MRSARRLVCCQRRLLPLCSRPGSSFQSIYSNSDKFGRKYCTLGDETVEKLYEKKSPVDHILLRPDTYVGSVQQQNTTMWIYNTSTEQMEERSVQYVPALIKIFDEILVNAADNKQRSKSMNELRVTIDKETCEINVTNNGKGIPIIKHKEYNCYIPELVLGNLLTGSNFNDSVAKVTGGRNGYGAKLTNIFSKSFRVETFNKSKKLRYQQTWLKNMSICSPPDIEKVSSPNADYTSITFTPDLEKFGIQSFDSLDIFDVMCTRVRDLGGCLDGVNVFLNDILIPSGFEKYLETFPHENAETENFVFIRVNERWKIGVGVSPSHKFQHVSFVNGINTHRGGTHVNYVTEQLSSAVATQLLKKDKSISSTLANHVKQHLFVVVNCLIENPAFSSQTKETLTTRNSDFGSECIIPPRFINAIMKNTEIPERVLKWVKLKQTTELNKGKRKAIKKQLLIPKLDDANWAGGKKSHECTLILTEGDSAKALAVAGLSVLGRDKFGVFPLKGKFLNVRDASHAQICKNTEISNLVEILGLNYNSTYEESSAKEWKMRYGKLMLMTDQDHDGSHIKGLIINFIHHFWPNLLQHEFFTQFITPIVKVSNNSISHSFFSIPEYNEWKESLLNQSDALRKWKVKYYKGLGTNTSAEAKNYFKHLEQHKRVLTWDKYTDDAIDLAFSKSKSELRKKWLTEEYTDQVHVDSSKSDLSFTDFVNKELIQFSHADIVRSIPSVVDGLKPSQRKVLFSCFKKKLHNEMKVAQLAGYVAEKTSYHHGEVSLHNTIISMAQDYVGSNNIPWLTPSGQFGTRLQGGNDHASARYIFTQLNPLTRLVFRDSDDKLLDHVNEDGYEAEPVFFVPVLPTVLINGCTGIGTGWSTYVPPYNPIDIIDNLYRNLEGKQMKEMIPYFHGSTGVVFQQDGTNSFTSRGSYSVEGKTIRITELPYRKWTNQYKEYLEQVLHSDNNWKLKNIKAQHTETKIDFLLDLASDSPLLQSPQEIYKDLSLDTSISTNNMHLFNTAGIIKKYESPLEIMDDFILIREGFYVKRKQSELETLEKSLQLLENKKQFCRMVMSKEITIFGTPRDNILKQLVAHKLVPFAGAEGSKETYDYLLRLSLDSFSKERILSLENDYSEKKLQYESLSKLSVPEMWKSELAALRDSLTHYSKKIN